VPRHRLAGGARRDPAGEGHLGPLARPVDGEWAGDHDIPAVRQRRRLGRDLAVRVAVERGERRVLRGGKLARVSVDRRARGEHEAGPACRRGTREPVGELDVRGPEVRRRAPRAHARQAGEMDHGVDSAHVLGTGVRVHELRAPRTQARRRGRAVARCVGAGQVVYATHAEALGEQRSAEPASDEAEPSGDEHGVSHRARS
jgi:hypothetical protein